MAGARKMVNVAIYDSFESLPESCNALFRRAESHSVFLSLPWFRTLGAHAIPEGSRLRIYALEAAQDGTMCLAMPMWHDMAAPRVFGIRKLVAVANFYTPVFGPLLAHDAKADEALMRLANAIVIDSRTWDMVMIHPMDRGDPSFKGMLAALRSAGMAPQPYRCFGNWYLMVNGRSYDEYAKTLPSRLHNTMKRKRQQLDAAGRLRMEIVGGGDRLDDAIAAYDAVYRASWKPPEACSRFMPEWIRACARQGWLRLGIAWIDGRPAAAQVWIVAHGTASIYKLAYDKQFAKHSAGSLLTAHLMRHVIDIDRVQTVDFLSGDDAYKQDWMSHRRERWGIAAFNLRTVRGLMLAAAHFGWRWMKPFLKRLVQWRDTRTAPA